MFRDNHTINCRHYIGDKKSTAVNISFACGHFKKSMMVHELCETTTLEGTLLLSLSAPLNEHDSFSSL